MPGSCRSRRSRVRRGVGAHPGHVILRWALGGPGCQLQEGRPARGAASPVSCCCARGPRPSPACGDRGSGQGRMQPLWPDHSRTRVRELVPLGLAPPRRAFSRLLWAAFLSCILSSSWPLSSPSDEPCLPGPWRTSVALWGQNPTPLRPGAGGPSRVPPTQVPPTYAHIPAAQGFSSG